MLSYLMLSFFLDRVVLAASMPLLVRFYQIDFSSRSVGKYAFAALFALLIVWLIAIPAARLGLTESKPPWWRNVRFWAIAIAATQMLVYLFWG